MERFVSLRAINFKSFHRQLTSLYMVHSEVMDEAESPIRKGKFVGSVGVVNVRDEQINNTIQLETVSQPAVCSTKVELHPLGTYSKRLRKMKRIQRPEGPRDVFQYRKLFKGNIKDSLLRMMDPWVGKISQSFEVTFSDSGSFQSSGNVEAVEAPSIRRHVLNRRVVRVWPQSACMANDLACVWAVYRFHSGHRVDVLLKSLPSSGWQWVLLTFSITLVIYAVPSIGAFVVVVRMMDGSETCGVVG